ncbi:MAG: hypothetical protein F4099_01955 [Synechococcus sp. SB0673_bin_10]|nr:hypothetical protein [Cyanobacteria bacterium MAG IRC4_bin_6]MXY18634.1 hypothetical protein [Synechococcus sp. SB0664_bin_36]MYI71283.1 hypothetical protein [Synechococcus sp. SB0673_bin_10]
MLGLIWFEMKASEARLNKRIDELRDDMKTMDARHREDLKELRDKVDALPSKILELLRTANYPVTSER